jgi:type II secretory pathway pseudopilin PulG
MSTRKKRGFTIVEIAVVAPILILVVVAILAALYAIINNMSTQVGRNGSMNDTRAIYKQLESDIEYGLSFYATTLPSTLSDVNTPVNGKDYKYHGTLSDGTTSSNLNTLFIQSYNQTKSSDAALAGAAVPVTWGACPTTTLRVDAATGVPIAIIYYVNNGILYRRTVVHNDTFNNAVAKCGTPRIRQSCQNPPQTKCTVEDQQLLTGVTNFIVDYYASYTDAMPINAYDTTPSIPVDQAKSIVLTIKKNNIAAGELVEYQSSMRFNR